MFLAKFHALHRAHRCFRSVSSWDQSSNFRAWRIRRWRCLTCIFPNDGPFFSRILAWRTVDWVNRTFRIDPKTLYNGFPGTGFHSLRNQCIRVLRDATQLRYNFHNSHSIPVVPFSSLGIASLSLALCLVVHQPYVAGTNTFLQLCNPFLFCRIHTREDAIFTKRSRASNFQKYFCTEWHRGYLCLEILLFLDGLRPRDTVGSEGVAALWSGFRARSLLSCLKLHGSPVEHWPFSFHL